MNRIEALSFSSKALTENPLYFSMRLPQEAVPETKVNEMHVLALIHPQKKLIKCQHPRRSLFSVFF